MEKDEEPVDRESWRRVLQHGAGTPPRATDERIRAEARRALAPHTGHWWLPASLAASLLLAVLVVQWQYEETGSPAPVTEYDVAPAANEAAATVPAADEPAAGAPAEEVPLPAPRMVLPAPPAAPAVAGKAAPAAAPQRATAERAESEDFSAPALRAESAPVTGARQSAEARASAVSADESQTPEQWYARIEGLRAAGRHEEAEAELLRLEQAFPGWVEEHLRERQD